MDKGTDLPPHLFNFKLEFDLSNQIIVLNENEEESPMTDQAVNYLIDEIAKKKKELHTPRHRCNRFFGEICKNLLLQHGLVFSVKTLERKYHYLKRQFDNLSRKNRGHSKGSTSWPFFDKLMEVFAEELAIEDAPTMASLYPDPPLPKSALPITQGCRDKSKFLSPSPERTKPPNESTEDGEIKETKWNHSVILEFLDECLKRKSALWDPNCSRREIMIEIHNAMTEKGYTFMLQTLDRKLQNFKTCYDLRAFGLNKNKAINEIRWPYFPQLHELYNGYQTQRKVRYKPSLKKVRKTEGGVRRKLDKKSTSLLTRKKRKIPKFEENHVTQISAIGSKKLRPLRIKPDPFEQYHLPSADDSRLTFDVNQTMNENLVDRSDSAAPENNDHQILDDVTGSFKDDEGGKTNSCKDTFEVDITEDIEFANKLLVVEERRIIATEKLVEELKESNRIRQKKIEFNQKKLSYLKARAKRRDIYSLRK